MHMHALSFPSTRACFLVATWGTPCVFFAFGGSSVHGLTAASPPFTVRLSSSRREFAPRICWALAVRTRKFLSACHRAP